MKQFLTMAVILATLGFSTVARAQPDQTTFNLSSPEFTDGGVIDAGHSCDKTGTSLPLHWENVPEHTAGFAVTMDDPDAPTGNHVHWLAYNIPAKIRDLAAGAAVKPDLGMGAAQGINSSGKTGFDPVCPPNGEHHYVIRVYALSALLDLPSGTTVDKKALDAALQGHVLAQSEITARYARHK